MIFLGSTHSNENLNRNSSKDTLEIQSLPWFHPMLPSGYHSFMNILKNITRNTSADSKRNLSKYYFLDSIYLCFGYS